MIWPASKSVCYVAICDGRSLNISSGVIGSGVLEVRPRLIVLNPRSLLLSPWGITIGLHFSLESNQLRINLKQTDEYHCIYCSHSKDSSLPILSETHTVKRMRAVRIITSRPRGTTLDHKVFKKKKKVSPWGLRTMWT